MSGFVGKICGTDLIDRKYCYRDAINDQLLQDTLQIQSMNFSSLKCENCILMSLFIF